MLSAEISPSLYQKLRTTQAPIRVQATLDPSGGDTLLPGAAVLPPAIGSKLTVRNALIGAGLAVGGYVVYALLTTPKRTSLMPKSSSPVAGLFSFGKRRRRRR